MSELLFAYGSLKDEDVFRAVTGHDRGESRMARLNGYAMGETIYGYPAIWPKEHGIVHGLLIDGISGEDLTRLDSYEGVEYKRVLVEVRVDGEMASAWVYVGKP